MRRTKVSSSKFWEVICDEHDATWIEHEVVFAFESIFNKVKLKKNSYVK